GLLRGAARRAGLLGGAAGGGPDPRRPAVPHRGLAAPELDAVRGGGVAADRLRAGAPARRRRRQRQVRGDRPGGDPAARALVALAHGYRAGQPLPAPGGGVGADPGGSARGAPGRQLPALTRPPMPVAAVHTPGDLLRPRNTARTRAGWAAAGSGRSRARSSRRSRSRSGPA